MRSIVQSPKVSQAILNFGWKEDVGKANSNQSDYFSCSRFLASVKVSLSLRFHVHMRQPQTYQMLSEIDRRSSTLSVIAGTWGDILTSAEVMTRGVTLTRLPVTLVTSGQWSGYIIVIITITSAPTVWRETRAETVCGFPSLDCL